jgi:hypothetical protein
VIETWHRVVAGEWRQVLDGLPGGRRRLIPADRGGNRLMDRHWNTRTRPSSKSIKSVRGTRFEARDKEGTRCRSGCQEG